MGARIATAAIGIPIVAYAITAGNPWALKVLLAALGILMTVEFARAEGQSVVWWVLLAGFLAGIALWAPAGPASPWILALIAVPAIYYWAKEIPLAFLLAGWILLPLLSAISLRAGSLPLEPTWSPELGGNVLLLLVLCLWAGDTMAYFVGKNFGKHKLAPAISPAKTWEGAIANLVSALAVGAAFAASLELPIELGMAIGAIAGILGQAGDLFQSAWKRRHGVKDSGALLPGHGGMLDRFDSLLFCLPAANALAYIWRA